MRTRARDLWWAAVALAVLVVLVGNLVGLVWDLPADPGVGDVVGVLIAFALTVLLVKWLAWGAWLRTKWGCPPGGSRVQAEARHQQLGDASNQRTG